MYIKNDYKKYLVVQEDGAIGDECDYNSFLALTTAYPSGGVHIEIKKRKDGAVNSERVNIPGGFVNFYINGNGVFYDLNGTPAFTINSAAGNCGISGLFCSGGSSGSDLFFLVTSGSYVCIFDDVGGFQTQGTLFYLQSSYHILRNIFVTSPQSTAQIAIDNSGNILVDGFMSTGSPNSEAVRIMNNSNNIVLNNIVFSSGTTDIVYIDNSNDIKITNSKLTTNAPGFSCVNTWTQVDKLIISNSYLVASDYCVNTANSSQSTNLLVDNNVMDSLTYPKNPINGVNMSQSSVKTNRNTNLTTLGNGFNLLTTPADYIHGFYWRTNGVSPYVVEIQDGICKDSSGEFNCYLDSSNSIYPLTIDGTVSGAGGLDGTSSFTAGNWFALYVIWDSSGLNPISAIAGNWINSQPSMPPGYDKYRYIGSLKCEITGNAWMNAEARGNNEREVRVLEDSTVKFWGAFSANTGIWASANISGRITPKPSIMHLTTYFASGGAGSIRIRGYQNGWATNWQWISEPGGGSIDLWIDNFNAGLFDYNEQVTSGACDIYGEGWKERI